MKKLLSILLTVAMLLSVCAFAQGEGFPRLELDRVRDLSISAVAQAEGAKISLSDFVVFQGETLLVDLSGLGLNLGVYDGEATGLQLALSAAEQEVLALNVAVEEDQLLLGMTGMPDVYSLNPAAAAETIGIEDGVIEAFDVENVTAVISEADQMALSALLLEAAALVQVNTVEAGTEEIDGIAYGVTNVELNADQIQPLLEKAVAILDNYSYLLESSGMESFTQVYESLNPGLGVSGVVLTSEEAFMIDFAVAGTIFVGTEDEESGYIELYVEAEAVDETKADLYVEASAGAGEESFTLAFNLDFAAENDGSWMPAADAPVDLLSLLEDEARTQQLTLQATSVAMMALSQMAAANETVSALIGTLMAG